MKARKSWVMKNRPDLVEVDEEKAVIRYLDLRITVPPYLVGEESEEFPDDFTENERERASNLSLTVNQSIISAISAAYFRNFRCMEGHNAQDDAVSLWLKYGFAITHLPDIDGPDHAGLLRLVDIENSRLLMLRDPDEEKQGNRPQLMSVYNGLLWIQKEGCQIFSLFFDMKDIEPLDDSVARVKKMYYRPDLSFRMPTQGDYSHLSGCQVDRYLYQMGSVSAFLVDLAERKVYEVRAGKGRRYEMPFGNSVFVGRSGGKIGAWTYSLNKRRELEDRLRVLRSLHPDQEEYDLSEAVEES
ncbi:hypothetical protein CJU89_5140 [Yarrowia sp. B02]|nr:hypothetical protein CJU89_5140 [Yarrowia sp. B02]